MSLFDIGGLFNKTTNSETPGTGPGFVDTIENILDPANIRKQLSGIKENGLANLLKGKGPTVKSTSATGIENPTHDWRVKISLPTGSGISYGDDNPFLSILSRTRGVVFPYTPNITVTHNARYQEQALTHSNYKNYFYEGSDVSAINIVGDFTVQNKDDALYLLAAIYFFRSCTKMFFGGENAGNPPPIVNLSGYGDYYFPNVSCVVTSFQHTMPADVDYIEVAYTQGSSTKTAVPGTASSPTQQIARVPTVSQINVTVQPIYSRKNIANNMSLSKFSQGGLLKGGFL